MLEVWDALLVLLVAIAKLLLGFAMHWSLLLFWIAWWLFGINWNKARPVLARGAWVPFLLVVFLSALLWSQLFPSSSFGLPNFWWQLVYVGVFAFASVCCGWLQDSMEWAPADIILEPPLHHDHHGNGHHHHDHH